MNSGIDKEGLKENLKDGNVWVRLLFMVLFAVIYSVAEVVLAMVIVFQFLCVLVSGERNDRALSLGSQIAAYIYQVLRYLTYNLDERPYPFADWPCDAVLAEQQAVTEPAVKKAAPKRKATSTRRKNAVEEQKPASSD
ncbi:MAG: DUF4389 domain-containing protein [Zetaproteobacteria bacterium CG12_big_fil_rev_8_21_14_0_65_55_1124]|nr:MAG: hypothetical protein AUJ58_00375 [Zetaproteobacteria bacterium CG1_02_55_237]PIS20226.1 MAG: DUF4389 domain-containing protein [Zetaproteobacteria bacterium CG08_land_8_20_14_0_20_55_17]PIW43383.1 MAG: DUF4389 domain-containing protein [Zetaproteobacteria bacterium CG12_big_fil_rev_8_21_14_0_65_55_1124]PIY53090.1 MAG: DUF4389 domain-containing protein [Zetaproteobacteria bacterium CG_4_10_14_0_8_um_filter_55_43]PIZ39999.1 MAG: DUF4389 domain-containing protein [Zetaproteobacteria bacter